MVDLWMPGAERLTPSSPGGTPLQKGAPRVVWHTTESPQGDVAFKGVHGWLTKQGTEPTLLWDPSNGRIGQYFPANRSGRALANDGTDRTNRTGSITIQIEVMGRASAAPLKNGPTVGLDKILAWLDSLGIERTWPAGLPPAPSKENYGIKSPYRKRDIWRTKGGHYGHVHVPNNTHNDPGQVDPAKFAKKVVSLTVKAFKHGSMYKTPLAKPLKLAARKAPYDIAVVDLPAGKECLLTFQVRTLKNASLPDLEVEFVRLGWGEAGQATDETGHSPIPPATKSFGVWHRWRTVNHAIKGGGKLVFRVYIPEGASGDYRFVCKSDTV